MNRTKTTSWKKTTSLQIIVVLASLVLSYLFVSLAINNGNLWFYGLFLVFLILALRLSLQLLMEMYHGVVRK